MGRRLHYGFPGVVPRVEWTPFLGGLDEQHGESVEGGEGEVRAGDGEAEAGEEVSGGVYEGERAGAVVCDLRQAAGDRFFESAEGDWGDQDEGGAVFWGAGEGGGGGC